MILFMVPGVPQGHEMLRWILSVPACPGQVIDVTLDELTLKTW
jgi:hypothetical protein